jgi:hypothetical protein
MLINMGEVLMAVADPKGLPFNLVPDPNIAAYRRYDYAELEYSWYNKKIIDIKILN